MNILKRMLLKIKRIFKKSDLLKEASPTETIEISFPFSRLRENSGAFFITSIKEYSKDGKLKYKTIDKVFDFAYKMAFTQDGEHRNHRSGGAYQRKNTEIFANTFQGKLAECAACNFFYKYDPTVYPDFSTSQLGEWDCVDLRVCGKSIAIKSTKHFGQLMLLEAKDWNREGLYIPNLDKASGYYDFILLIRIKPSCEDILKKHKLLYSSYIDRERLFEIISNTEWEYNYAGYISHDDLVGIINNDYVLPQGALLNGKMSMDAANYYVQSGDLKHIDKLMIDN